MVLFRKLHVEADEKLSKVFITNSFKQVQTSTKVYVSRFGFLRYTVCALASAHRNFARLLPPLTQGLLAWCVLSQSELSPPLSQDNVAALILESPQVYRHHPSWIDFGKKKKIRLCPKISSAAGLEWACNFLFRNCLKILFKFLTFSNLSSTVDLIFYVHQIRLHAVARAEDHVIELDSTLGYSSAVNMFSVSSNQRKRSLKMILTQIGLGYIILKHYLRLKAPGRRRLNVQLSHIMHKIID